MPVLLLARGDQESKALLRSAIKARYGLGPPVLETLKLQFKGRTRAKVGPVTTWVPLDVTAHIKAGFFVRWDYSARPAGVAVSSGSEAFDGATWYKRSGRDPVNVINDEKQVESVRAQLWAMNALLLTPLGDHFVELRATSDHCFEATHREMALTSRLCLNPDASLEFAETRCLNPATGTVQTYSIRASSEQALIGSLILPRKITVAWDNQVTVELSPVAAQTNLALDDKLFRLQATGKLA